MPRTNIHRSVLVVSSILLILLLWLSTSFLFVAIYEKRDADRTSRYLATDPTFRQAITSLAEERSTSYWLSGVDGILFASQFLKPPRQKTDKTLKTLIEKLDSLLAEPEYSALLNFQKEKISDLTKDLKSDTQNLLVLRDSLDTQLDLSVSKQQPNLRTNVLASYQQTIEKVDLLRQGVTYNSKYESRETQHLRDISGAAWNIHIASLHLATLYEEYLTTGEIAYEDIVFDVRTINLEIAENSKKLKEIGAYANVKHELKNSAISLADWYEDQYATPALEISMAMFKGVEADYTRYSWSSKTDVLEQLSQDLLDEVDNALNKLAYDTSERATRNLAIDCLLLAVCFLVAIATYWIVRRVYHQATHDDLTGLPNRRLFTVLNEKILLEKNQYAVVKIDLMNKSQCISRTEELSATLSKPFSVNGQSISLKNCIGYACYPEDAKVSEKLSQAADLALYTSKQSGAGTVTAFEPHIAEAFQERQEMESELLFAIERDEFELHYQPQFDVGRQSIAGVEALIRWQHPEKGMVSPFHFIPVAEESGLLPIIGEWVINEAARQAMEWRTRYGLHLRMSVNVSVHQFLHGDIVKTIEQTLRRESLEPELFEVEVTESVAMTDVDSVIEKLNSLHKLGVLIALDDFGTGYSSLSYLQDLPLDTLKIDRSFITQLGDDSQNKQSQLLESITSMAKQLQLHTVAEGVETDVQLQRVCDLGIDTIQGYYYSKPVSARDIPADVESINALYHPSKAA